MNEIEISSHLGFLSATLTYERSRGRVDERERIPEGEFAKISISHDGDYATAMCIALNARTDDSDSGTNDVGDS